MRQVRHLLDMVKERNEEIEKLRAAAKTEGEQ
jgi:hypothetical protein